MTNLKALDTLTICCNISKIRLLIQISVCRHARIQMDISKKNCFSAGKAINYFPSLREKKSGTNMWNAWVFRIFLLSYASNFLMGTEDNSIQNSFTILALPKLELPRQFEITFWYHIVRKSSIVDDLWVEDSPLVCFFFLWETLPKRIKFNQVDIYIFKVKKKSTRRRFEISPKLTIKAQKRC